MNKGASPSPLPSTANILPAGHIEPETLRLLLQAAVYDPLTRRFLAEAGLHAGMRVLDVGSGLGSVSMLVSQVVGPTGSVVGVDCSAAMAELARRRVQRSGKTNIEYVQGDVESLDDLGPFDAVVGRFVLRELKNSGQSLGRLAQVLAPGGIVAFQEKVLSVPVTCVPPLAAVERARTWMDEARRRAGVELAMEARLPQVFAAAGLPSPQLRLDAPVGHGADWIGFDYLVETLRGMLPVIHLYDIASEREMAINTLAEEMRTEAARARSVVILTPCVGAWALRPAKDGDRRA